MAEGRGGYHCLTCEAAEMPLPLQDLRPQKIKSDEPNKRLESKLMSLEARSPERLRAEEDALVSKVYRRLVWFLVLLFITSYLDRINISYAALTMNKELGLTSTMFGLAGSLFYVAYIAAEIPSNMLMPRFGARIWIPRIMITWGLASAATMFATGPYSLYALRALTGLAEAGFMPGILLYLTYWFPASRRARATSIFIMAQPITIVFASTLSGFILEMNSLFGLAGWKWLFLIEGLPAVILGVVAYFLSR